MPEGLDHLILDIYSKALHISKDEFDFILEECTDEEMDIILIDSKSTFGQKRKAVEIVRKYKALYKE